MIEKTLTDAVLAMMRKGDTEPYFELKQELNDLLNQIEKVTSQVKVRELVKQIKEKL